MSQYSPRSILRRLDLPLLLEYFAQRPGTELLVEALRKGEPSQEAFEAFEALPDSEKGSIEADLRIVHDLATEQGLKCIQQEIATRRRLGLGVSIPEGFEELKGIEDKVLAVLLRDPKVVEVARLFSRADSFSERSWRRFEGLPRLPELHLTKEMGDGIAAGVKRLYASEGRGQTVTVERYKRNDLHYVFAFADDYRTIRIEHDERHALRRQPSRPTFELVYVYDPGEGTLEVFARGDRKLKNSAARLFTEVVFGPEVSLQPQAPTYGIDILRDRSTTLRVRHEDGVAFARVRKLRFVRVSDWSRRITFEVPPIGLEGDIYDLMDSELRHSATDPRYELTQAEIQLVMLAAGEPRRAERYRFMVTAPHHCNLRNLPDGIQEIAHRYLRDWGVSGSRDS